MTSWKERTAITLLAFGFASSYVPQSVTFRPPPIIVRQPHRDRSKLPSSCCRNNIIVKSLPSDDEITTSQPKASDGDALQALFSRKSDTDGLMKKEILSTIPVIMDLLSSGDLLGDELDEIWKNALKFPDVDSSEERIDVDSFIKIYRDIDAIFEDDDVDIDRSTMKNVISQENKDDGNTIEEGDDPEEAKDEQELEVVFKTLCDDAGVVSKAGLKEWSEIKELIGEGMLGEDEFEKIWKDAAKSPGSSDQLDVEGFLSFNVELDDLFVFDDIGDDDDGDVGETATTTVPGKNAVETQKMFYGEDLPAGVVFSNLANGKSVIGMGELKRWGDLQVMLGDGDLLPAEFQDIYNRVAKVPGSNNEIDEDGFVQIYNAIDSLFEDDEDEAQRSASLKADLLSFLNTANSQKDINPCGLDSLDSEVEKVLELVETLESEPCNVVVSNEGNITPEDIVGNWELLYTTSATMKFNKGISGLVPPGGKFGGLIQKLKSTKYLSDVEYVEKIDAGPSSFEVKVTGDWDLRNSVSLFTGARSVALSIEPDKVAYGITSTKGDHWKSLGPMNLLSFSYLDEDVRIMRGTTAFDNIFIFKRVQ